MKVVAESEDAVITQYEPKPKPAAKPAPTDTEIADRKKQVAEASEVISDGLFPNSVKPKPAAETPPKPDKPEETPPKPDKPAETPPKPAAKKPSKPAEKPPVDVEEVATRTARKVVEELAPKDELPEEASELTPEDQRHYAIFQQMGESNKKYEKLAEEFAAFAKTKYDYEKKWLKENPGKEFDPEAEEHEAFFKKQPAFDEDAYDDAKVDLRVKRATDDAVKRALSPIQQQQENDRVMRVEEPKLRKAVLTDTHSFVKGIAPEVAALLVDKDGNPDWSPANLEKAEAADPIAADVLVNAIKGLLLPQLDTLHRMFTPGMIQTIDPKLPVYQKVWDEINFFEESMSASDTPAEIKSRGGKEFITLKQWGDAENKILNSKAPLTVKQTKMRELEAKFWTVDINDIRATITRDASEEVKKVIERRKQIAHKAFGKPGAAAPAPVAEAKPKPAEVAAKPAPKPAEKPSPPSSAGGATQVSAETPAGGGDKKSAEIITDALFPK